MERDASKRERFRAFLKRVHDRVHLPSKKKSSSIAAAARPHQVNESGKQQPSGQRLEPLTSLSQPPLSDVISKGLREEDADSYPPPNKNPEENAIQLRRQELVDDDKTKRFQRLLTRLDTQEGSSSHHEAGASFPSIVDSDSSTLSAASSTTLCVPWDPVQSSEPPIVDITISDDTTFGSPDKFHENIPQTVPQTVSESIPQSVPETISRPIPRSISRSPQTIQQVGPTASIFNHVPKLVKNRAVQTAVNVRSPHRCSVQTSQRSNARKFAEEIAPSKKTHIFWTDATWYPQNKRGGVLVAQQHYDSQWTEESLHVVGVPRIGSLQALAIVTALEIALKHMGTIGLPGFGQKVVVLSDSAATLEWLAIGLRSSMETPRFIELHMTGDVLGFGAGLWDVGGHSTRSIRFGLTRKEEVDNQIMENLMTAVRALLELRTSIEIHWVPAPSGIPGNKIADEWARRACCWYATMGMNESISSTPLPHVSFVGSWRTHRQAAKQPDRDQIWRFLEDVKPLQVVMIKEKLPRTIKQTGENTTTQKTSRKEPAEKAKVLRTSGPEKLAKPKATTTVKKPVKDVVGAEETVVKAFVLPNVFSVLRRLHPQIIGEDYLTGGTHSTRGHTTRGYPAKGAQMSRIGIAPRLLAQRIPPKGSRISHEERRRILNFYKWPARSASDDPVD